MAENLTHYCSCRLPTPSNEAEKAAQQFHKAAVWKPCMWDLGEQISVRFLSGSTAMRKRVMDVALEWPKVANLSFDFRNVGPSDIPTQVTRGISCPERPDVRDCAEAGPARAASGRSRSTPALAVDPPTPLVTGVAVLGRRCWRAAGGW